jgi:hypothetical protein
MIFLTTVTPKFDLGVRWGRWKFSNPSVEQVDAAFGEFKTHTKLRQLLPEKAA